MADDTKPYASQAELVEDGSAVLLKVTKNGETLFVHPTALAEHLALGWARV